MIEVKIAFYKGRKRLADRLIQWWTNSEYSHCEIVIDGVWYSASLRNKGVRAKWCNPKKGNWDYVVIQCTDEEVDKIIGRFTNEMYKGYDILGLVMTQVIALGVDAKNKWFCSEICTQALMDAGIILGGKDSAWYSPERLYKELVSN